METQVDLANCYSSCNRELEQVAVKRFPCVAVQRQYCLRWSHRRINFQAACH